MPPLKEIDQHHIFFVRTIPGRPAKAQWAVLNKLGVPERQVYDAQTMDDARRKLIRDMREGEFVCVTDLPVLATDRRDMLAVLVDLNKKQVGIVELRTGLRSDAPHKAAEMALRAAEYWAKTNKKFGDLTASEAGKLGGQKAAEKRPKPNKMPMRAAQRIWRDGRYTVDEALHRINSDSRYDAEWSVSDAYRKLGKRGISSGPKSGR